MSKQAAKDPKPDIEPVKKSSHPKFIEMVIDGIKKLNERTGSSRQALLKYIIATYELDPKLANQHLKVALKNGIKNGQVKQSKGTGSNGSFKLGDEAKKSEAKKSQLKRSMKKRKKRNLAKKLNRKNCCKQKD